MKKMKLALPLLATLSCMPTHAALSSLLNTDLNSLSVFANTYVTTGASSKVYGSFAAGAGATVAASSVIRDNLFAGAGATLGLGSSVGGNFLAGAGGTLGADSSVGGSFQAGAAATLGANSSVHGNLFAGAAAVLGVSSMVSGNLVAGAAATLGASAQVMGTTQASTAPTFVGIPTAASVSAQAALVAKTQASLGKLAAGKTLAATVSGTVSLDAGVYSATALTTAAGTAIRLDGHGLANQLWVFNIDTYLVTGAGTTVDLINAGSGSSVIWNTGGYTTLGAETAFLGTIFANDYVTVAAHVSVKGPDTSCGGIFSASSNVTMGATATVGSEGCSGAGNAYWYAVNDADLQTNPTLLADRSAAPAAPVPPSPVSTPLPEPATLGLVFAGFAGMVLSSHRRRSQEPVLLIGSKAGVPRSSRRLLNLASLAGLN